MTRRMSFLSPKWPNQRRKSTECINYVNNFPGFLISNLNVQIYSRILET